MRISITILYSVFIVLVASFLWLGLESPLGTDVSVHLDIAQRMISGEQIYKDILVANLPYQYLFRIPVIYAEENELLPLTAASFVYTALIILIPFLITLKQSFVWVEEVILRKSLIAYKLCLLNVLFFIYFLYPFGVEFQNHFGQKEHIIFAFLFPYLLNTVHQIVGIKTSKRMRLTAGLFVVVTIFFKPFYAVVFAGSELVKWWMQRRINIFSIETVTVGIGCCLFFGLSFGFFSDYFFKEMQSFVALYLNYNASLGNVVAVLILSCGLFLFLYIGFGRFLISSRAVSYLMAMCAISTLPGVMQMKGWGYHFMVPSAIGLFAAFMAIPAINKVINRQEKVFLYVYITCLFLMVAVSIRISPLPNIEVKTELVNILDRYDIEQAMLFSNELSHRPFLSLMHDADIVNKYYSSWMPYAISRYSGKEKLTLQNSILRAERHELLKCRPDMIAFDRAVRGARPKSLENALQYQFWTKDAEIKEMIQSNYTWLKVIETVNGSHSMDILLKNDLYDARE